MPPWYVAIIHRFIKLAIRWGRGEHLLTNFFHSSLDNIYANTGPWLQIHKTGGSLPWPENSTD